jgi:hypothetical protein
MVIFAMFMTLVQTIVEDHLRGRVVSIYTLAFRGAMPLSNLVGVFAASLVSVPTILVANGLILVALGSAVLLRREPEGVTSL